MYCHLRPPDAIAADEPNAVSFRAAVGRHVNAAQRVCDGLGQNKIVRVRKTAVRF